MIKLLNDILAELAEKQIKPGHRIAVNLYTDRFPCHSCGGIVEGTETVPAGLKGVIGDFTERMSELKIDVEVNVLYQIEPKGQYTRVNQ